MAGSVQKYAFINAKLRARISKLLSQDYFTSLIRTPSLGEALAHLDHTPYRVVNEIYKKTGDLKLGELELFGREVNLYREMEKYVRRDTLEVVQALLVSYEVEQLKGALRLFFDRKVRDRSVAEAARYIYRERILRPIPVEGMVNAESLEEIARLLEETPYAPIIDEHKEEVTRQGSLFFLEVALDHYYYRNLIDRLENLPRSDRRYSLHLIGVEIDLENINWIIRFRSFHDLSLQRVLQLIIPRGTNLTAQLIQDVYSSQSMSQTLQEIVRRSYPELSSMLSSREGSQDIYSRLNLIKKVLEQIMTREVQRVMGGYPFTIGIILCYFILQRKEIRGVQTVLNAKQYRLPEDRIRGLI